MSPKMRTSCTRLRTQDSLILRLTRLAVCERNDSLRHHHPPRRTKPGDRAVSRDGNPDLAGISPSRQAGHGSGFTVEIEAMGFQERRWPRHPGPPSSVAQQSPAAMMLNRLQQAAAYIAATGGFPALSPIQDAPCDTTRDRQRFLEAYFNALQTQQRKLEHRLPGGRNAVTIRNEFEHGSHFARVKIFRRPTGSICRIRRLHSRTCHFGWPRLPIRS